MWNGGGGNSPTFVFLLIHHSVIFGSLSLSNLSIVSLACRSLEVGGLVGDADGVEPGLRIYKNREEGVEFGMGGHLIHRIQTYADSADTRSPWLYTQDERYSRYLWK